VVSNVSENKMHLKAVQEAVGFETHNIVAVPLVVRGRTFGVLELLNRVGETEFTPTDVELLNACAQMSAKAIEIRLMIAWAAQKRVAA
jgi:GAF domain-containing protein